MTYEEKLDLYKKGLYSLEPPPVPHGKWTDGDWIVWIDSNGKWHNKKLKKEKTDVR